MVKAIVDGHRGVINVQSVEGEGTRFDVLLPSAGHGDAAYAHGSGSLQLSGFALLGAAGLSSSTAAVERAMSTLLQDFTPAPNVIGLDCRRWSTGGGAATSQKEQISESGQEQRGKDDEQRALPPRAETGEWSEEASTAAHVASVADSEAAVLVVDDNAINRRLLQRMLQRQGVTAVCQAENGREALNAIERRSADGLPPFSLILLDLNMPVMNGFDFLVQLRSTLHLDTPVVTLTASRERDDEERGRALGANEMMWKPVSVQVLRSCLQRYMPHRDVAAKEEHRGAAA